MAVLPNVYVSHFDPLQLVAIFFSDKPVDDILGLAIYHTTNGNEGSFA